MTKKERYGLSMLITHSRLVSHGRTEFTHEVKDSVSAAMDWIRRQMAIDERRRKNRGKYRKHV